MKRISTYLKAGSAEALLRVGEKAGLTGEALELFGCAFSAVPIVAEVEETIGLARIVEVAGCAVANDAAPPEWRYIDVSLFGHRSHFGRAREIQSMGAWWLEVEILDDSSGPKREEFGAAAIYSRVWLTDEEGSGRLAELRHGWQREGEREAKYKREQKRREEICNAYLAATTDIPSRHSEIMARATFPEGVTRSDLDGAWVSLVYRGGRIREVNDDTWTEYRYRLATPEERDDIPF